MARPRRSDLTLTAKKNVTERDLDALPETVVGEIIDGELYATPRPGGRHVVVASFLGSELVGPYSKGRGGPGGWWILDEPQVHLAAHIIVPDLAGWKRDRLPAVPEDHRFVVVPDWVCEILSSSTAGTDRMRKMPIYAQHGVKHAWLIHPVDRTLEVFRLDAGRWILAASYAGDQRASLEPFVEIMINLRDLWPD